MVRGYWSVCFNHGISCGENAGIRQAELVCGPLQSTMRKLLGRPGNPVCPLSSDCPQLASSPPHCWCAEATLPGTLFGGLALHVSLNCWCDRHRGTTPLAMANTQVETKKNVSENTMIRSHLLVPLPAWAAPGALYLQFHRILLLDSPLSLTTSRRQGLSVSYTINCL